MVKRRGDRVVQVSHDCLAVCTGLGDQVPQGHKALFGALEVRGGVGAWQAVGLGVSELSTAFAQSLEMGARLEDVAGTIHAHPTLGEAVQEAALRALGHALHL